VEPVSRTLRAEDAAGDADDTVGERVAGGGGVSSEGGLAQQANGPPRAVDEEDAADVVTVILQSGDKIECQVVEDDGQAGDVEESSHGGTAPPFLDTSQEKLVEVERVGDGVDVGDDDVECDPGIRLHQRDHIVDGVDLRHGNRFSPSLSRNDVRKANANGPGFTRAQPEGGFVRPNRTDGRPVKINGSPRFGLPSGPGGRGNCWPKPSLRPGERSGLWTGPFIKFSANCFSFLVKFSVFSPAPSMDEKSCEVLIQCSLVAFRSCLLEDRTESHPAQEDKNCFLY
jgi:hypothetical protein